jgi:uncharacterized membrane protein YeaQ/YmgE (transglycosylase-associated protein family)
LEIISFIIVGLIVGALARFLLPGRDPIGILGTIVLGIVGAIVGGYIWTAVFGSNREGVAWIGSILAAMLLLGLYRSMTYRKGAR